jgi:hypothetical protein
VDVKRKTWRLAFAGFLDRLAGSDHTDKKEWSTFVVTHYPDEELEAIRRECVRLSIRAGIAKGDNWSKEDRAQLQTWAGQLRDSVSF